MPIFTQYVSTAAPTKVFARNDRGIQHLAFELSYGSFGDTSLIVPIPVSAEDSAAFRFVDLSRYRDFFSDLDRSFPRDSRAYKSGNPQIPLQRVENSGIEYHESIKSLAASTHQVSDVAWKCLHYYQHNFGFVVVKLETTYGSVQRLLPFAFAFRPCSPGNSLYYPTVDISKGTIDSKVEYDTELYYQGDKNLPGDFESTDIEDSVDIRATRGVAVQGKSHKRHIFGSLQNGDTVI